MGKEAEEEYYAPFREKTGLHDLHAYDEATGPAREDFHKKRRILREQIAKLTAQKEYQLGRDFETPLEKLTSSIHEKRESLEETKKKDYELVSQLEALKSRLSDTEAEVS